MGKQIIITKPKTISSVDKQKLSKHGSVVIEHPNPSEIIIVSPVDEIKSTHMLMAALRAIVAADDYAANRVFARELETRLKNDESILNPSVTEPLD